MFPFTVLPFMVALGFKWWLPGGRLVALRFQPVAKGGIYNLVD